MKSLCRLIGSSEKSRNMREFAEKMRKYRLETVDVTLYRQFGFDEFGGAGLNDEDGIIEIHSGKETLRTHYFSGKNSVETENKLKDGYKEAKNYLDIKDIKIGKTYQQGVVVDRKD